MRYQERYHTFVLNQYYTDEANNFILFSFEILFCPYIYEAWFIFFTNTCLLGIEILVFHLIFSREQKNKKKLGPKNLENYIFDCKAEGIIRIGFIFPSGMLN